MSSPRVSRAKGAAVIRPSANDGSTRCETEPQPHGGNQPSWSEKTKANKGPNTKDGTQMPMSAKPMGNRSIQVLGRDAAITPIGIPTKMAMSKESDPRITETGMRAPMIWFTVQPGYFIDGPKEPCARLPI